LAETQKRNFKFTNKKDNLEVSLHITECNFL
jgi:hypothetical protein